jgi:hypothetical protein
MEDAELIEIFEDTFRTFTSGCRRTCCCGKTYYNGSGNWDFDEGEIEELEKNGATPVDHSIGGITFEGREFADACTCWHPRALQIIHFVIRHDEMIANFLNKRRERTVMRANAVQPVKV